jgi:mxaK protein
MGAAMRRWMPLLLLVAALGVGLQAAVVLWRARAVNARIDRLETGRVEAVARDAPPLVLAARARAFIRQGKLEDAQAIADRMPADGPDRVRAELDYALGNAHLRAALNAFRTDPMKQVVPIINLAKSEYRQALARDPGNWDARYNLDIAMALVREAAPPPPTRGDTMAGEKPFWPNVPGTPNGLP